MDSQAFESQMRMYEAALDQAIPPELWFIVRLDGIGFSQQFKKTTMPPFCEPFSVWMEGVTSWLSHSSGFQVVYGYTMSDEISLLVHSEDQTYGRKVRKILSCLAGQASSKLQSYSDFNMPSEAMWAFDARISVMPHEQAIVDYFRWRQSEATRNCINGLCYWKLRGEGLNKRDATTQLRGMNFSEMNEFLFKRGLNFNDYPVWARRGVGTYFEIYRKIGKNKRTGKKEVSLRRHLVSNRNLPKGDNYDDLLRDILKWSTVDDRVGQLMQQEQRWFEQEKLPELLQTDRAGSYALVYNRQVVDFYACEGDAFSAGLERYGHDGLFLILCVEEPRGYYV